jgi:hypothetical protein
MSTKMEIGRVTERGKGVNQEDIACLPGYRMKRLSR